ncbi:transcription-repair coupling factor [Candidatus Neptunochlamydia vexilliferae]|nr:transcription-repair coupling factor [Candidatus Neptunochlamydia vexilliferae]
MLESFAKFPSIQAISEAANGHSLLFEGLWDSPKAILALLLYQKTGKNILVITGGERETRLFDDLEFFAKGALSFPAWELLPGEEIAPSPDIVGKRLEILHTLLKDKKPQIVLTPLQGILQKVSDKALLEEKMLEVKKGDEMPFDLLPEFLVDLGYRRETVAADKGQFAIRGGIVDVFPLSSFDPYRIDFFGDEIDTIRTYDPISQKSTGKVENILIPPADEFALLKKGTTTLLDYLDEPVVIFDDLLAIEDRYVSLKDLPGARSTYFLSFADLFKETEKLKRIFCTERPLEELSEETASHKGKVKFEIFDQAIEAVRVPHAFARVEGIDTAGEVTFVAASEAEENAFRKLLPDEASFERGYLSSGFTLLDGPFTLLPYTEVTKRHKVSRQKWRNTYHTPASEFHALEKGDLVVHFHNGIGKFCGVEKQKNHRGNEEEFLLIEYANSGRLYVPLSQSHLVSRYIGSKEDIPTLNTLGTKKWQQAKVKAQNAIIGYAKDLLQMQAEREARGGFTFPKGSDDLFLFEEEFPFVETQDQLDAIQAIKEDMESNKAMDRLVCGDVGYGKTEVAMRAAFKAAYDGKKQVAVLVPTTVLAMQHYETFKARMADFPVTIGVASRFVKPKEVKQTLEGVARGTVDILIGTHRIISQDVKFRDLGLIIIDEEQRFGVRAKEHLKKAKVGVDCLTLSATPIPRTLYGSLIGARDMSVINTPPQDRLPIKTILAERDDELIKNALLREMARDGQVYFIHNRVETIHKVADHIRTLVPNARVIVGHGQMTPDEIDMIFHQFKEGEADILVATTIVENGIDIPNANTILIDRADAFGMAALYQLRGRVGRWNRPAYAYFLVPKNRTLQEVSTKRLQALVETSGFGGGMKLAMRDLEIRGAGDILGVKQSGNVAAIGFHFYCKLLKRTIDTFKKELSPTFFETRLEFSYDANLPSSYIEETHLRMELYHRLGETTNNGEVDALFEELVDRFGPLPPQAKWLYHLNRIRIFASQERFTLLKFEKVLLHAKRQMGKKLVEKKIFLPTQKDPEEFEFIIIGLLKRDFDIL